MDAMAEISELKTKVAKLEADTNNLVRWQKDQNGALMSMVENMEELQKNLTAKIDRLQYWIMTQAVGFAVGLLLLLLKK